MRQWVALMAPVAAFTLQWLLWPVIQPWLWLLFFIAVFTSSWFGGRTAGLASTIISIVLASWFFLAHQGTVVLHFSTFVFSVAVFCVAGVLVSISHGRLQTAYRKISRDKAVLAASAEHLSITLHSIGGALVVTDTAGRITHLNAIAEQLTGWTQAEADGHPIAEVLHIVNHDTREPVEIPVMAVIEEGASHALDEDAMLISRNGSEYSVADSCAPMRDRDGHVIGAVMVFRDVSEGYAAKVELRDSNTRIQTIFASVADGIVTINEQGIIQSANPAVERMFGYAPAEIIGQNVKMLAAEPYRDQHDGYIKRYLTTGEAHILGREREVRGQRKDGSTFPMGLFVNEMRLHGERHFAGILRDITERKEAEERLNLFFTVSPDMLCVAGVDGYFKRVNPAFTATLGWSEDELLARPYLDFVHPDDLAATQHATARLRDAAGQVQYFENRYRHKDGTWRYLAWRYVMRRPDVVFATARDMTERKQMEDALVAAKDQAELANRAKDAFLATMSHEIRTPLTGMLGMMELLSMTRLNADQYATLNAAWESGRGLLRIVSDILDWSKLVEEKLELSPRATSLHQVLMEVVNTYSRVASSKDIVLMQHTDPHLAPAHFVDPLRLSQVLNNFVSNAIKFTERGEVVVSAELVERHEGSERIRFSVKDTGPGIAREVQQQLFQRFHQESADTARMYGGTGLGLAICRRLAELMGGELGLESEPGRGSTFSFTLTLPVSVRPGEPVTGPHFEVRQRRVTPLIKEGMEAPRVLAVDDNAVNRMLLARELEFLGLLTATAEDGRAALELWRGGGFAAVITDCHMPEMDGYELTREIRAIEAAEVLSHTPVIAWTANAMPEEAERCRAAGMDEMLVKPNGLAELKSVLAKCLHIAQAVPWEEPPGPILAPPSTAPVDLAVLGIIVPEHAEQLQVLHDFQSSIHADEAQLKALLAQDDHAAIVRQSHRMKGSARMIGAMNLGDACADLEQAARNDDKAKLAAATEALEAALAEVDAYLAQLPGYAQQPGEEAHEPR